MDFSISNLINLITPITALVAVVVASRLSYSRSSKEKIWDLRRQAYGVILSELAIVERVCDDADEFIEEDAKRYFSSDHYSDHNNLIAEHMAVIRERFSDDYLIFSDTFITLFEGFLNKLAAGTPDEIPSEEHERFMTILRESRPLLKASGVTER